MGSRSGSLLGYGNSSSTAGWTLCNAAAHDTTLASHQSMMLTAQVLQIFDTIESELALKDIVITQTPDQILLKPIRHLHSWVTRMAQQMQNLASAVQKCALLHTSDIHNYFSAKHQPETTLIYSDLLFFVWVF